MTFLTLITAAITLLITTFFLIETHADRQDLRPLTTVPSQIKANVRGEVPVDTEDFKITRLKSTNSYIVLIKKSPFNEAKIKAEEWFDEHFPETDICEIKISFMAAGGVTGNQSSAVEGCDEPVSLISDKLRARIDEELSGKATADWGVIFSNDYMNIVYSRQDNSFVVTVFNKDKEQLARQEAAKFFQENGVDINSLGVIYRTKPNF